MSPFLNSLEGKLTIMEQKIRALPQELDSVVARLDQAKLRNLTLRLDQDFNGLLDRLFDAQRINALLFPFVFMPSGLNGPLYRRITDEDLARWRAAWKSDVRVVLGKEGVAVIAVSELAKKYRMTVPRVILAVQQQGYTVLGWDEYQKLLDEIGNLIGRGEEQDKAIGHTAHIAIGIPVTATDSPTGAKVLPTSPLSIF